MSVSAQPKRVSHMTIIGILVFGAVMMGLIFSVLLASGERQEGDALVLITFLLNGLIAIGALVREIVRRPYSLLQVHWIFFLVFFVVAPFSQYCYDYHPWGYYLMNDDRLAVNLVLFAWGILVLLFSSFYRKRQPHSADQGTNFFLRFPEVSRRSVVVLVICSVLISLYALNVMGISQLLSRSEYSLETSGQLGTVFERFLRATPMYAVLFAWLRYKQSGRDLLLLVLAIATLLIVDFPTAMARYRAAAIYGGLFTIMLQLFREKKAAFPLALLLGLLVLFPTFAVFRAQLFSVDLLFDSIGSTLLRMPQGFCTGDYDAYSMLARSLTFLSTNGSTGGFQFLGVLLFFVPRSLWPAKPIGSGAMIAELQGQSFTNVACPLPGEMIVNFGIPGLIISAILLGLLFRHLDEWQSSSSSYYVLFHPTFCMMLFFIMRGDLMSSFAYFIGFLVPYAVAVALVQGVNSDVLRKPRHTGAIRHD